MKVKMGIIGKEGIVVSGSQRGSWEWALPKCIIYGDVTRTTIAYVLIENLFF